MTDLLSYLKRARHECHSAAPRPEVIAHMDHVAQAEGWEPLSEYLDAHVPDLVRRGRWWAFGLALLPEVLKQHKAWWNAPRGEEDPGQGEIKANLRWADLRGADLRGAYLRRANLWGANLRWADLRGANLRGARLWGADLRGAYLRGANLRWAYLRWADLRGAYLRGAYLRGAYLRRADLRRADLRRADLRGADLRGADLRGAYLEGVVYDPATRWPDGFDMCGSPDPARVAIGAGCV